MNMSMREELLESVKRMSREDCSDVQVTFKLASCKKADIKREALKNEDVAEYVLMY